MKFLEYSFNETLSFSIKSIKKIEFKNTYYQISYFSLEGIIRNQKDIEYLEYILKKNISYDAKATSKILDFTELEFEIFTPEFNLSNQYAIITKKKDLKHENVFSSILDAVNFLVSDNIKKFQNAKHHLYTTLPKMQEVLEDKDKSSILIKAFLSEDKNIGYLRLIGNYPYKGYLEANYISNMLDILIEFKPINKLIIDVKDFSLETGWDNDLPDLEPTHVKYYKTKEVEVFYLITEEKEFMNNHDNLFFSLDNIISKINSAPKA